VDELGITDRVTVVRSRAEDLKASFDVVMARAVAPLDRLVGWCAPLRGPQGVILALKGATAAEEVRKAAKVLAARRLAATVLVVRAHPGADPTTVVRLTGGNS
jgi:16S rRNA (guanine527-N7)-methyltransferase